MDDIIRTTHPSSYVARFIFTLIVFFASSSTSEIAPYATFAKDATKAPEVASYDYIIVGGGTSGCALAASLSQGAKVLVLERGGLPYGIPSINTINGFIDTLANLGPTSPSQTFVSTDGVVNQRARVLGGGSALNAGFFTKAEPDFINKAGLDPKLVRESYKWVAKKVAFEPKVLAWQAAVRDGLLEAGVLPNNGFTLEHLYGTKVGGSIFDQNGRRHTAADLLEYADPNNITIYLKATVHRILFKADGTNAGLILEKVTGPLSVGVLELETVNLEDNPKVTFNYFQDPRDLQTCVQGMQTILNVLESTALSKFRDPLLSIHELLALVVALPLNLRPRHINAPFELEQYCKDTVMTIWHYHGGCQVDRVVDRNYKVVGVGALRVIDSSTFLSSPGTNPQATVMMLGRYMGAKMLGERMESGKI